MTRAGTFEHGASVLQLPADPADAGAYERIRSALLAARAHRVRPGRDDKVVAAWNGLAIAALAEVGLLLERTDFIAAARGAAELLTRVHLDGGRLARTSRDGIAGSSAGVLEDYGNVAEGLIALAGVTGEARWAEVAGQLLETTLDRFAGGGAGFYDTADDSEQLIYRPADPADGPSPSGVFAVAGALLQLLGADRLGPAPGGGPERADHRPGAGQPVPAGGGLGPGRGRGQPEPGPVEIAVVGPAGDQRTAALHRTALLAAPPGAVLALGDPAGAGGASTTHGLDATHRSAGSAGSEELDATQRSAGPDGDGSAESDGVGWAGRGADASGWAERGWVGADGRGGWVGRGGCVGWVGAAGRGGWVGRGG